MSLKLTVTPDNPEDSALVLAAEVIQAGGVIVYPTETLYGIGANALNSDAVRKVLDVKKREKGKAILVIVHSAEAVEDLVEEVNPAAQRLMDAFWPGPLTLIFKSSSHVPEELTQGTGTLGIRVPSSKFCLKLLRLCDCPVTSTSANISGQKVLRSIVEIERAIPSGVDMYLDAGLLTETKPSTVVDVTGRSPRLLREGAIALDRLLQVVTAIQQ